jgi:glycosyltransferase involved in cell wall biosynthesis
MKTVFFSLRTFEKDGGGTIRMYGILNALAEKGHEVIFISNAKKLDRFHPAIQHIHIDWVFNEKDKRVFQGLLGALPPFLIKLKYQKFIDHIQKILKQHELQNRNIVFFEYLDNSVGYLLKKLNIIKSYINDIHGIATIEFKYQMENGLGWKTRLINRIKYNVSNSLDYKVFKNALGFIFASKAMDNYFKEQYPFINGKEICILPYVISKESLKNEVNLQLRESLIEKFGIKPADFVFFFAGGFKPTAGVEDLINAFAVLNSKHNNLRLLILGRGDAALLQYKQLVDQHMINNKVQFIDSVPYAHLRTYQDLAHVIVCPDRQNPYSELIVHLKYFDALASGKIVVNSGFNSVKEINYDERLSLNFTPSSDADLTRVLEESINNYNLLQQRYSNNLQVLENELTYNTVISAFETAYRNF